jgi:hypothetical protein
MDNGLQPKNFGDGVRALSDIQEHINEIKSAHGIKPKVTSAKPEDMEADLNDTKKPMTLDDLRKMKVMIQTTSPEQLKLYADALKADEVAVGGE